MPLALVSTFKCCVPPLGFENVDTVDTYTREYININCIIIYYLWGYWLCRTVVDN